MYLGVKDGLCCVGDVRIDFTATARERIVAQCEGSLGIVLILDLAFHFDSTQSALFYAQNEARAVRVRMQRDAAAVFLRFGREDR